MNIEHLNRALAHARIRGDRARESRLLRLLSFAYRRRRRPVTADTSFYPAVMTGGRLRDGES